MILRKKNLEIKLGAVFFGWRSWLSKAKKAVLNFWCSAFMDQAFLGDMEVSGSFSLFGGLVGTQTS